MINSLISQKIEIAVIIHQVMTILIPATSEIIVKCFDILICLIEYNSG